MKKFFFNLLIFITLTGCVESISLIGPTSSVLVSGNVAQPTLSAAINHGVKKKTGKNAIEYVLDLKKNKSIIKNKKNDNCLSYLEQSTCEEFKSLISETKKNIIVNSKIKNLN
tara:strand:+ start:124 stop:462 length:339 start_codon:yes stop_codon:yes gene_type:complete